MRRQDTGFNVTTDFYGRPIHIEKAKPKEGIILTKHEIKLVHGLRNKHKGSEERLKERSDSLLKG